MGHQTINDLVVRVLSNVSIVGEDLSGYKSLVHFISNCIIKIEELGVKACLKTL